MASKPDLSKKYTLDISLLIIGYDPYIDVWNHYFKLLNKYWTERPATYLATNKIVPKYENVTVIPIGEQAEWSAKVYSALDKINTEYVVLLLEDFFTTRPVNNSRFFKLVDLIKKNDIEYCKLLNQSRIHGKPFKGLEYLHIIDKNDEYGISLQPSIWKKSYLQQMVGSENYNAWIFEMNQIKNRNQNKDRINALADDRNILEITHAVVQSKYLRRAVREFKKQGYSIDTSQREQMSKLETLKYVSKQFFSEYAPKSIRPFLIYVGKKLKIDFVSERIK